MAGVEGAPSSFRLYPEVPSATRSPEETPEETSAPRSGIDDRPDAMRMENRRYFNQEGKEAKNFYHLSDDGGEESEYRGGGTIKNVLFSPFLGGESLLLHQLSVGGMGGGRGRVNRLLACSRRCSSNW